jgi:hypothetical protein
MLTRWPGALCSVAGAGAGPAGPHTSSQAMAPPPPKPTAIASLGAGGAAAASRKGAAAAALAALQAAARPPKQLASELTGPAITVTGMTGARVYCQFAQPAEVEAAAGQGGSRSGGLGPGGSKGSLLQQPMDVLLDMLADRRRRVGGQLIELGRLEKRSAMCGQPGWHVQTLYLRQDNPQG